MSDTTTRDEAWFYAQGGQRKGPVPADKLHELLAAQTIDSETPVWRKGLANWQPLRTTEIGAQIKDIPPPITANHVNNGLVWALALAPIAYLFVDLAVLNSQNTHIIQWQDDSPVYDRFFSTFISPLPWLVPLLTNAALCLLDTLQLKRAGYSSGWLTLFALLLAPVIRNTDNGTEMVTMRWGMPPPPRTGGPPVTNIRNTSSPHWGGWLKPENRCLVPANSFAEYAPEPNPETKKKDVVWFALNDVRPLFGFAGIWTTFNGDRGTKSKPVPGPHQVYGFLTTAPNAVVADDR